MSAVDGFHVKLDFDSRVIRPNDIRRPSQILFLYDGLSLYHLGYSMARHSRLSNRSFLDGHVETAILEDENYAMKSKPYFWDGDMLTLEPSDHYNSRHWNFTK
jgi:prepilin-type processing-associated H-X9-DG protein